MYDIKPVIPYVRLVSESQEAELILLRTLQANIIIADWNILLLERDYGREEERDLWHRSVKGEGDWRQRWEYEPCYGCTGLGQNTSCWMFS